jgi:hypothetical protein
VDKTEPENNFYECIETKSLCSQFNDNEDACTSSNNGVIGSNIIYLIIYIYIYLFILYLYSL